MLQAVLAEHIKKKGEAPEGYKWEARHVREGVVVEQVQK